jgi:hypothetical protein
MPDAELSYGNNRSFVTPGPPSHPPARATHFRSTRKADIRFQRHMCRDGPTADIKPLLDHPIGTDEE